MLRRHTDKSTKLYCQETSGLYTAPMSSSALFVIASLIWGSTYWAITLQLGHVAPAVSVAYRFFLAAAALFAICLVRRERLLLPWRAQRWAMLQGLLTFSISYVCTYEAEQYVLSGLVAILYALMVFWTPLWSRLCHGTPISGRSWACGMVAILGVTMLFYHAISGSWQTMRSGSQTTFLIGIGLTLVATLTSSFGTTIVTAKVKQHCDNLPLSMAWSMLWGAILVALWSLARGHQFTLPASPVYWMGMVYLAIFGSVVAFFAYFTLIHRIGANKAVYIGVITPVLSVLLSVQFEHYRPGLLEFFGMLLCLASVAWAVRPTPSTKRTITNLQPSLETP